MEKVIEETEDNPPSEPSTGEPPFANQPQPVYPEESSEDVSGSDAMTAPADGESSTGEPPFANQPEPVYPDGAPD
jgi:hypothetical protein